MSLVLNWPALRAPQEIASAEIHVWAWPLDILEGEMATHVALLDEEERDRLHRFHFERDQVRFALAHGNMRRILGAYLHRPPQSLRLSANRFGKPKLFGRASAPTLHFNLSHSRSIALLALSPSTEIGVDVEEFRAIEPEVAESHFSACELSDLRSLRGVAWLRGFYSCWTRKEAILKAEGVGLNLPLDAFDVSLLPGAPPELLGTRPPAVLRHSWKLHDLSPAPGTVAALASESAQAEVSCFSFG